MTLQSTAAAINWRLLGWGGAALLLLLPAAAMAFTPEMNWGPGDFLAFAGLLLGAGAGLELTLSSRGSPMRRAIAAGAVLALALLVWAELAVGIF
ncbi:MAG: hypothetical protein WA842_11035 [Croceibacterium sp.]